MKGVERKDALPPVMPVGGKKRCTMCKAYKNVSFNTKESDFSTTLHTRKNGKAQRYWRGKCKACYNAYRAKQGKSTTTWWVAEQNARDIAATRLIKAAPNVFLPLFIEELVKKYKELGLSDQDIQRRIEYRTKYVKVYIQQLG